MEWNRVSSDNKIIWPSRILSNLVINKMYNCKHEKYWQLKSSL